MQRGTWFSDAEYRGLLQILLFMGRDVFGHTGPDPRRADIVGVTYKLCMHAGSAIQLHEGTSVDMLTPGDKFSYVDFASIVVVARAAVETYFTLYETFVAPQSEDEFTFNWNVWKLAGWILSEKIVSRIPAAKEAWQSDVKAAAEARNRIIATSRFKQLTRRQQGKVLHGRRIRDWEAVAAAAGFNAYWLKEVAYRHYSGFAHADAYSVGMSANVQKREDQIVYSQGPLEVILILVSKTILDFAGLFVEAAAITRQNPRWLERARVWADIAFQEPASA